MASTFAGFSLFDSGPHRFIVGRIGRLTRAPFSTPTEDPFTTDEAARELAILQTGRLVASTNAALWALVDAIKSHAELPRTGTLVDHHGRSWTGMTLYRFDPADRIDRGREYSLSYRAVYLKFGGP